MRHGSTLYLSTDFHMELTRIDLTVVTSRFMVRSAIL